MYTAGAALIIYPLKVLGETRCILETQVLYTQLRWWVRHGVYCRRRSYNIPTECGGRDTVYTADAGLIIYSLNVVGETRCILQTHVLYANLRWWVRHGVYCRSTQVL